MQTLILARHGESEASVAGMLNGDPAGGVALTAAGREQARLLGEALGGTRIDLCVVTEHRRTQETAEIALAARGADPRDPMPLLVLPALTEVRFGAWEGRSLAEYRTWALAAGPAEPCPGGGESRAEIAARLAEGFASLVARPEAAVLCVGHSLSLRYLLDAAVGLIPAPRAESVPYAEAIALAADAVVVGATLLAAWAERPVWRSAER